MAQTIYDAAKTSEIPFTVEAFLQLATSDEMFGILPFVGKDGESFSYTREKSLGSFGFVADDHSSVPESTGADEVIAVAKREAVADFKVRNFAQKNLAGRVNPLDRQTVTKFKAAGQTLAQAVMGGTYITGFTLGDNFQGGAGVDALVDHSAFMDTNRSGPASLKYTNTGTLLQFRAPGDRTYGAAVNIGGGDGNYTLYGDNPSKWITVTLDVSDFSADSERVLYFTSTTNEMDGLATLMSSGQIRSASGTNGDEPTFAILDELLDSVKVRDNMAFVMNADLRRKYKSLLRATNATEPMDIMGGKFRVPTYEGVPILKNDWILSNESKGSSSNLSSVYLASFSAEQGFWMGALGGEVFDVQADPRDVTVLGFRLEDLGQIQAGASAVGRRLMFFGGAALGSDLAAARAKNLITT